MSKNYKDMLKYIDCGCDGNCKDIKTEIKLLIQAVAKGDYVHKSELLEGPEIKAILCRDCRTVNNVFEKDRDCALHCIVSRTAKKLSGRIRKSIDRKKIFIIISNNR